MNYMVSRCLALVKPLCDVGNDPTNIHLRTILTDMAINLNHVSPKDLNIHLAFCMYFLASLANANNPNDRTISYVLAKPYPDDMPDPLKKFLSEQKQKVDRATALFAPNHFSIVTSQLSKDIHKAIESAKMTLKFHINAARWKNNHSVVNLLDHAGKVSQINAKSSDQAKLAIFLNLLGWGPIAILTDGDWSTIAAHSFTFHGDIGAFLKNLTKGQRDKFFKALKSNQIIPANLKQSLIEASMAQFSKLGPPTAKLEFQPMKPLSFKGQNNLAGITKRLRLMKMSADGEHGDSNFKNHRHAHSTLWQVSTHDGRSVTSSCYRDFPDYWNAVSRVIPEYLHDLYRFLNTHWALVFLGNITLRGTHNGMIHLTVQENKSCDISVVIYFTEHKPCPCLQMSLSVTPLGDTSLNHPLLYPLQLSSLNASFSHFCQSKLEAPFIRILPYTMFGGSSADGFLPNAESDASSEEDFEDIRHVTWRSRVQNMTENEQKLQKDYASKCNALLIENLLPTVALNPISQDDLLAINNKLAHNADVAKALCHVIKRKIKNQLNVKTIKYRETPPVWHKLTTSFVILVQYQDPASEAQDHELPIHCLIAAEDDNQNKLRQVQLIVGEQRLLMGAPASRDNMVISTDEEEASCEADTPSTPSVKPAVKNKSFLQQTPPRGAMAQPASGSSSPAKDLAMAVFNDTDSSEYGSGSDTGDEHNGIGVRPDSSTRPDTDQMKATKKGFSVWQWLKDIWRWLCKKFSSYFDKTDKKGDAIPYQNSKHWSSNDSQSSGTDSLIPVGCIDPTCEGAYQHQHF